jgi:hypothetical protein
MEMQGENADEWARQAPIKRREQKNTMSVSLLPINPCESPFFFQASQGRSRFPRRARRRLAPRQVRQRRPRFRIADALEFLSF